MPDNTTQYPTAHYTKDNKYDGEIPALPNHTQPDITEQHREYDSEITLPYSTELHRTWQDITGQDLEYEFYFLALPHITSLFHTQLHFTAQHQTLSMMMIPCLTPPYNTLLYFTKQDHA